jgi:CBS domain containing-hemolysin-like protein
MSTLELSLFIGLAVLGLILSASFSGIETGLYTINRVRLIVRAGSGDRRASRLLGELDHPTRLLITILLGNNIADYCGSYGLAAILDNLGLGAGQAVAINSLVLVPVLFIFGETLPKDLFRTHSDQWSYAWSGFLVGCRRILTWTGLLPLVMAVDRAVERMLSGESGVGLESRQRISQLIKEGVGAGVITETQTTLADRALSLRDRTVASEMVPWRKAAWLHVDASPTGRKAIQSHAYTRVPVVDGSGKPVGVVALIDLVLEPNRPTRELMTPAVTLSAETPVRAAMQRMRRADSPLAIVVDRRGMPIGIVTLKDLVEPLVGELAAW